MQKIIGKFVAKSAVKTGVGEHGAWHLITFFIEKTHNKKKIRILFTAFGKRALFIDSLVIGERISIHYYPKCTSNKNFWNTELIVTEVEKHVKRTAIPISLNGELVNRDDFFPKEKLELEFNKPVESPVKIDKCKKCGTQTSGVDVCGLCEFGC